MSGWDAGRVARLGRVALVPSAALAAMVRRLGECMTGTAGLPGWDGERLSDRELAAELCAGCLVPDECLELEFRESGRNTVGVWGGLTADDRRELYPAWLACRTGRSEDATGPKGGPQR